MSHVEPHRTVQVKQTRARAGQRGPCSPQRRRAEGGVGSQQGGDRLGAGPGAPGAGALLLLPFPSGAQAACSITMVLGCHAQRDARMFQKALVGRPSVSPSLPKLLFIMHTDVVFSQLHLLLTRDAWVGFGGGGLGTWVMGRISPALNASRISPPQAPYCQQYLGFCH